MHHWCLLELLLHLSGFRMLCVYLGKQPDRMAQYGREANLIWPDNGPAASRNGRRIYVTIVVTKSAIVAEADSI